MAKKLTYPDRKKMLEARDKGSTDAQIKTQFGFKDDRTLTRHMKLAEQEQEARLVRVEIIKDALAGHLAKIGDLIERWQHAIAAPPVYEASREIVLPIRHIESDVLFKSLKEHIPSPTLWRNYAVWNNKLEEYIGHCKKLRRDIEQEAGRWRKVRRLTDTLSEPILRRLYEMVAARYPSANRHSFSKWVESINKQGRPVPEYEILLADGTKVIEAEDVLAYRERYNALSDKVIGGEGGAVLMSEYDELKRLGPKLHEVLRDILLRQDYIMYTCWLCPGQAKPLRSTRRATGRPIVK